MKNKCIIMQFKNNLYFNSNSDLNNSNLNFSYEKFSLPKLPIPRILISPKKKNFSSSNSIINSFHEDNLNNKESKIKDYKFKSNNNILLKGIRNNKLKRIKSDLLIYKIPKTSIFHKNLMAENQKICSNRFNKELFMEKLKNKMEKENIENKIQEKEKNKEFNIYEQIKQIQEDIKYKKEYKKKGMEENIKNILKSELHIAKEKLKIKEEKNNKLRIPLIKQKLSKYKYISYQNPILEINEYGTLPTYIKDGKLMYQLFYDSSENCNNKKYKVHF